MQATTPPADEGKCEHSHFLTKPLFEIFRVSIQSKQNNESEVKSQYDGNKACKIHGIVRVSDEYGKRFDFYNRTMNDLETLNFGGFLSLQGFPIIASKLLTVSIRLYDADLNIEIANGVFDIDYRKMNDYDKVLLEKVEGKYGFATVYHATFQHASIASIEKVVLHNEVGGSSPDANLFGTIVARLERKYGKTRKYETIAHTQYAPTLLFDNRRQVKESNPVQATFDVPIKLFRSRVVVPFNCSLTIEADFWDNIGNKIVTDLKWNVYPLSLNKESVGKECFEMQVEVRWFDVYNGIPREVLKDEIDLGEECKEMRLEVRCDVSSDAEQSLSVSAEAPIAEIEEEDIFKLLSKAQQPLSSISRRQPCAAIPRSSSCVEVFSVFICVDDGLDICGTIEISDSACRPFFIFNGHERLCDRKTLSVVGSYRSFNDKPFSMHVNLKDDKGRVVSKGSFMWSGDDDSSLSFYDKHLCSVIRGDIGYAAIHYSIITYGARLWLRVVFRKQSNADGFVDVYGMITATYGNYEYPSQYDWEYYKITLFSKPKQERVRVKLPKETLDLSKSVVSVPLEDSLILDVNLKVTVGKKRRKTEDVRQVVEFNADTDRFYCIKRPDYEISISVDVDKVR